MCMRVCDRAVVTSANGSGVGGENPLILKLPHAICLVCLLQSSRELYQVGTGISMF